jgi:hypothetical protein
LCWHGVEKALTPFHLTHIGISIGWLTHSRSFALRSSMREQVGLSSKPELDIEIGYSCVLPPLESVTQSCRFTQEVEPTAISSSKWWKKWLVRHQPFCLRNWAHYFTSRAKVRLEHLCGISPCSHSSCLERSEPQLFHHVLDSVSRFPRFPLISLLHMCAR